jgi:hypothetical protein
LPDANPPPALRFIKIHAQTTIRCLVLQIAMNVDVLDQFNRIL